MRMVLSLVALLLTAACAAQSPPETTATPTFAPTGTQPPIPSPTVLAFTPTPEVGASPTPSPAASPAVHPTAAPSPTPTIGPAPHSRAVVNVGGARFQAEVAATTRERSRGLSGRPNLAPGTGMLFVFDSPGRYAFWMYEMRFPLDLVWIGPDCNVVDLTRDAPAPQPGQGPGDLPRYRPAGPARYVLEVNAGEVASAGIELGDAVSFEGDPGGHYGC